MKIEIKTMKKKVYNADRGKYRSRKKYGSKQGKW